MFKSIIINYDMVFQNKIVLDEFLYIPKLSFWMQKYIFKAEY